MRNEIGEAVGQERKKVDHGLSGARIETRDGDIGVGDHHSAKEHVVPNFEEGRGRRGCCGGFDAANRGVQGDFQLVKDGSEEGVTQYMCTIMERYLGLVRKCMCRRGESDLRGIWKL